MRFYSLGGKILSSVSEAKYLGLTFSNNFGSRSSQWKAHILETSTKANQKLGFLRRNLHGCPYKLRELAFITLVRSSLEYCGAVWDTTVKEEAEQLERVQRRAARWARGAHGIISVTALLRDLNWPDLADRRRNQRLCLFYKVLNGELDITPESLDLIPATSSRTRNSHHQKLQRVAGRDTHSPYWKGTVLGTIPEWNILPKETVEAIDIEAFKRELVLAKPSSKAP